MIKEDRSANTDHMRSCKTMRKLQITLVYSSKRKRSGTIIIGDSNSIPRELTKRQRSEGSTLRQ